MLKMLTRPAGDLRTAPSHRLDGTRRLIVMTALSGLFLAACALSAGRARADEYPSRLIRMIVPYDPGAAVDVVARMVAEGLSAQIGKPVIVENRPGGMTLIGAESVARAEPDGYTLFFSPDDTFTILPQLSKAPAFDPNKHLLPVAMVGKIVIVLLANPAVPAKTLPELIAYARANPGKLNYGTPGAGSAQQLSMELLKARAKIDIVHVPYKGNAPALAAVTAGEVQLNMIGYGTSRGLIQDGKLNPIAIIGPERETGLPNVPTTAELGYPDLDATTWLTLAVPAKTPSDIVEKLNQLVGRALQDPDTRKRIELRNIVVTEVGPKALADGMAQRSKLNGEAIRISGAQRE